MSEIRDTVASEALQYMFERRSVRDGFDGRPVSSTVIEDIVEIGRMSPSSKNAQPWKVHVVEHGHILGSIAQAMQDGPSVDTNVPIDPTTGEPRRWTSTVRPSARVLEAVSVALFIENRGEFSGGRDRVIHAASENKTDAMIGYAFEVLGIGMMISNMWNAARVHGLEGVFMGDTVAAEEYIHDRLGMTGDLIGVLALGYVCDIETRDRVLLPRDKTVAYHTVGRL